ncbi:ribosome small subunit-dependent GTPase A [Methanospirillum hungatei]|uniref:ribosome small subunit-dependent GTPase A n=1 Tax=Methanospirillum hungatei TaxID=2203 RepID=UPI0026EF4733|nr:ribosome small subunit-dependent GTPase A [Methanospirillum hungatei]MCA1916519.1 ribosome small subunit-dependent GTPase A [Methanospirillum hungatei]
MTPTEILSLPISGAMKAKKHIPVVGDFVAVLQDEKTATQMIVSILERKNCLSRGGAGESAGEQVLAANIDTVFIVTEPGHDFSIPRLERYLLIIRSSGATPVIIFNKSDTCDDMSEFLSQVKSELGEIAVIPISALNNTGLEQLNSFLAPGKTVIFLGSSGVGKSTLINTLTGTTVQKTGEIREDDGKGRHTTTVRHLVSLPSGSCLIDTPGMREIRIWTAEESVQDAFEDIAKFSQGCRFSDCTHEQEPGCAVRQAVEEGEISAGRLERYKKLLKEAAFERGKAEIGLKRFEKIRYKGISQLANEYREKKKWDAYR